MRLYSSNNKKQLVTLEQAVLKGLAPDNGLYLPAVIPSFSPFQISEFEQLSLPDIALLITKLLLAGAIPVNDLENIIKKAVNFDAPLVEISKNIYSLELFHGPTLAFKDFGARFMAGLTNYYCQKNNKKLVILVATSGDTGGAVADAFLGSDSIQVVILYPSGKVSELQEKQLTTLGKNIKALEVAGNFDDCQQLVKQAFLDQNLTTKIPLSSANSINIARLIPQSFYYFYAYSRLPTKNLPLIFSVPSGNFGNLTAGVLAKRMGLPIHKLIAATNSNNVIPKYLKTGEYTPCASFPTISNAMDVGNPSNFARLNELFLGDLKRFQSELSGYSFSDLDTMAAIKEVFDKYSYLLDPHGAVSYLGVKSYLHENTKQDFISIFLETAHPAKFKEVVEKATQKTCTLPPQLASLLDKEKTSIRLENNFSHLKEFLVESF